MRHQHHPILHGPSKFVPICLETLAIDDHISGSCGHAMHVRCIAGQYSMGQLTSCAICRYVFSDPEVINFRSIFANAGIDAGGAALDSPQNVLAEFEDVPVLPLCCSARLR